MVRSIRSVLLVYAHSLAPEARNRASRPKEQWEIKRGLSTAQPPYVNHIRPPSLILPTLPLERIPRLAPPTVAAATGNGSSPWKRRDEKGRERESSLYKHQYARRNVTIFQHSVQCSSSIPHGVRSVVSRSTIHPRDHRSPSMDLIVRQVMHRVRKVQIRGSIGYQLGFYFSLKKAFEIVVWSRMCFREFPAP